MFPSEFWECTLLDIANFMVGNMEKQKQEKIYESKRDYMLAQIIATMNATNLGNAFSKSAKQYPKFESFFPDIDKEIKKEKNESHSHEKTYDGSTEENRLEFLKLQKKAYEEMGIKFN